MLLFHLRCSLKTEALERFNRVLSSFLFFLYVHLRKYTRFRMSPISQFFSRMSLGAVVTDKIVIHFLSLYAYVFFLDTGRDRRLASHILNIHMNKQAEDEHKAPIDAHMFKRYDAFIYRVNPKCIIV